MSDHNAFEQFDDSFADTPHYADRTSRPMAWARTVLTCALLLGGLAAILPMMPDKDPRGTTGTAHAARAAQTSMLTIPGEQSISQDAAATQPMSIVRHSGDMRHRT